MIYWTEPTSKIYLDALARDIAYLEGFHWSIENIIVSDDLFKELGRFIDLAENTSDDNRIAFAEAHNKAIVKLPRYTIRQAVTKQLSRPLWYQIYVSQHDITDFRVL